MLQQLEESKACDCYMPEPPNRVTPEQWRQEALASAYCDLGYAKEVASTKSRNRWLAQLRESLRLDDHTRVSVATEVQP